MLALTCGNGRKLATRAHARVYYARSVQGLRVRVLSSLLFKPAFALLLCCVCLASQGGREAGRGLAEGGGLNSGENG